MSAPVVVTGASGFIGTRLSDFLESKGAEVVRWTRKMGDLRDAAAVDELFKKIQPSQVFHLAACGGAADDRDWSLARGEVAMVQNLATAMPPGGRLIYTGSVSEYGYGGTLSETDPRHPRSSYGFAKACATDRAMMLAAAKVCSIRIACLFGVYGPGESATRLVPHLVSHLTRGQNVSLRRAAQTRDLVHVDDVCAMLERLAAQKETPSTMLNFGTGVGVSVESVCYSVVRWLDADPSLLQFGVLENRQIDEPTLIANTHRLQNFLDPPHQHWLDDDGPARDYVIQCAQHFGP